MKKTFLITAGSHVENGKVYKKGSNVSSEKDLVALYGEKFILIQTAEEAQATIEEPQKAPEPLIALPGEDKTDKFPLAAENGYTVCKSGNAYIVLDEDNDVISEKQDDLTSVGKVKAFIEDLINN